MAERLWYQLLSEQEVASDGFFHSSGTDFFAFSTTDSNHYNY